MNVVSLLSLGLPPNARAVVAEAVQAAFSHAALIDITNLDDQLRSEPTAGLEFLLVGEIDPLSLERARAALDRVGLKRWAIVGFGTTVAPNIPGAAMLTEENWKPQWVAQILKMVAHSHELARDNARLRGDMSTVGRRISHDMRSPLSGIYTSCEAIDEILSEQTKEHVELTQAIISSTDDLIQIVDRVSFLLKASAEQSVSEEVPMGDVVFRALQSTESAAARKGASITQPANWPQTHGNSVWLEVIWLNLLRNALEHSSGGTRIEIGWSKDVASQHLFWVENSGKIHPQRAGKLFHPFHLLHQADAPRGLGLPVVRRLVELQGGTCGFAESKDGGTRFFFALPAA